jgi:hypothetical protein
LTIGSSMPSRNKEAASWFIWGIRLARPSGGLVGLDAPDPS